MAIFACLSKNCFWDDTVGLPPEDGYLITDEQHQYYLDARTAGKIVDFSTCPPSLIEPPPVVISAERLAEIERSWRNVQLTATDGVVARHRDELEGSAATTLTAEQYRELQAYRQALRNWPEAGEFPLVDHRPSPPLWLAEQTQ